MKNIIVLIFVTITVQLNAQTVSDALRYSNLEVGGTARTVGIGGAIGALGADYSVLSTNPAGLAAFRTNEFVFTPSVYNSTTTSTLETGNRNSPNSENIARFHLQNIGIILNYGKGRHSTWPVLNFGIGFNRLASFNQNFRYEGTSQGSIVERFTELANADFFDQFEVIPAEDALAIYTDANGDFTNDFEDLNTSPNYLVDRTQTVNITGSYNEMVLSFGANLKEKLMFGATVGIPFISFDQSKVYTESELEGVDDVAFFDNLSFEDNVNTSGSGVNLKLGVIYRINQMFRLGVAYHTGSRITLTDNFSTQLDYSFTLDNSQPTNLSESSPDGTFEYRLFTPSRAIVSGAVLLKRKGFISADVEYVDYSRARFDLGDNIEDMDFQIDLNNQIGNDLVSAINIRLGGEYAHKKYRFRAGYTINGTPYADDDITNNAYSLGVGLRKRKFYLDAAFKSTKIEEGFTPFLLADPEREQSVTNEARNSQILLTLGFKF